MQSLFEPSARQEVLGRLDRLQSTSARQWGKMNAAQMMEHCARALEVGTGDKPLPHTLIGKILGPLVKKGMVGDKPFSKNSPTDPKLVVSDERDFASQKTRLTNVIGRFCELGPDSAGTKVHSFFGKLTGDEWGRLMYKHLDHHLKQFSS
jgi:hypothetical protein